MAAKRKSAPKPKKTAKKAPAKRAKRSKPVPGMKRWACEGPVKTGCGGGPPGKKARVIPYNARERSTVSSAKAKAKTGDSLIKRGAALKAKAEEVTRETAHKATERINAEEQATELKKRAGDLARAAIKAKRVAKQAAR